MFSPNISHRFALKRLAQYFKNTQDLGLLLDPNSDIFKVDAYPDDDFSEMYGHKKHDDTACAQSRTGFIVTFDDCTVLWISKLQTKTALSTTEAEIIAFAHCCQELFQIIEITRLI